MKRKEFYDKHKDIIELTRAYIGIFVLFTLCYFQVNLPFGIGSLI